jgi:hypothetical protein
MKANIKVSNKSGKWRGIKETTGVLLRARPYNI